MIFRFRRTALRNEDPCKPGRRYRLTPLLPCLVIGPTGRLLRQLLLDTGSVGSLLPISVASTLGIRSFSSPGTVTGVGGNPAIPIVVRYAEILFRIQHGLEVCQWKAVVGFSAAPLRVDGILGISGGLEYFHTTLDFFANQISLIPRVTLPVVADTP